MSNGLPLLTITLGVKNELKLLLPTVRESDVRLVSRIVAPAPGGVLINPKLMEIAISPMLVRSILPMSIADRLVIVVNVVPETFSWVIL